MPSPTKKLQGLLKCPREFAPGQYPTSPPPHTARLNPLSSPQRCPEAGVGSASHCCMGKSRTWRGGRPWRPSQSLCTVLRVHVCVRMCLCVRLCARTRVCLCAPTHPAQPGVLFQRGWSRENSVAHQEPFKDKDLGSANDLTLQQI